ncbi:MAG: amidase family protein [Myxococcota bacterium]
MTAPRDPFHHLDATAQAALVATGEASARELAEAAIARIEQLDPPLNAVVSTRFEHALAEADAIDATPRQTRGPLAGVPFLVKETDALGGEPYTLGSRLFEGYVAPKDAGWIAEMRGSGLVALGKTNVPEFGLIHTTESMLYGPCRNPWDHDVSTGGSSGGACVAVATGMVPLGSASDGGGSIRYPASACGIVGFKPSRGRGVPPDQNIAGEPGVVFAVTRSVRDTARLLELSDGARVAKSKGKGPAPIGFVEPGTKPLRVAMILPTVEGASPEPDVEQAVREAARLCEQLGHTVEEATLPMDGTAFMRHIEMLWASFPAQLRRTFWLTCLVARGWRWWRWPRYEDALEPWTRGLADFYRDKERAKRGHIARATTFLAEAQRSWARFFASYDLLIGPVQRRAAHPIGELDPTRPFDELIEVVVKDSGYAAIQNFVGLPAVSLPLGTSAEGLPLGVMFTGPAMGDATLLKLAYQLEEAAPWAERWPPA